MSNPRTGAEIREAFLSFFEAQEHLRMPSDSLVPSNDPTLLFTGAGMNQFKDEFLGRGRDLSRATTSQKCLRVPDLENVGVTPRHHTFFEMLGNFSFGDYFKKEVIAWEWEFFTQVLGWDPSRFVVTVYEDDQEAFDIWHHDIGLPPERIYRFGEKENFWPSSAPSKGPNGVCGPCSEIYWDQEPKAALPNHADLDELPDRFVEVGNFVFTQFERLDEGVLQPLPKSNIDVGLGFERIVAVAQEASNNFETDLFEPILNAIQTLSSITYGKNSADDTRMRRIADHARAVFFCIADGAGPGRDGRGYVVRKILRRAIRDGIDLKMPDGFLAQLLPSVQESLGKAYPELFEMESTITALVSAEETRFREVYDRGIARLQDFIKELPKGTTSFPGDLAFKLHDSWGFPSDITEVIVQEHGLVFDKKGFDDEMQAQKERARAGSGLSEDVFSASLATQLQQAEVPETNFCGYDSLEATSSITALLSSDGLPITSLNKEESGEVLLSDTPFYAEGGGQVGDCGLLLDSQNTPVFQVESARAEGSFTLHTGKALQQLEVDQEVCAKVAATPRALTEAHHSATHLLQAALRSVVGDHVNQAGSRVSPEGLRFDYTHNEALTVEQIRAIEDHVAAAVTSAIPVVARYSSFDEAKQEGVTALFGEKYGSEVRIVDMPGLSKELCGGTHVANTGCVGSFRILQDRALAAGVRRMEAVCANLAVQAQRQDQNSLQALAKLLKCPAGAIEERVATLQKQLKQAKKSKPQTAQNTDSLLNEAIEIQSGFKWLALPKSDANALREVSDSLKANPKCPPVLLLIGTELDNLPFCFLCSPDSPYKAGSLAKQFGALTGGGGGGRPDFAQGQGQSVDDLPATLVKLADSL